MLLSLLFSLACSARPTTLAAEPLTVHYETCGAFDEATTPIVFLHDGIVHSAGYDAVWEIVCAEENVGAVRYDRRGYGQSPRATERYSSTDDLEALLAHLNIKRAVFVAASASSALAVDLALRDLGRSPERVAGLVRGLVLVGPSIGGYPYSQAFIDRNIALIKLIASKDLSRVLAFVAADPHYVAPGNTATRGRLIGLLATNPQAFEPRPRDTPPPRAFGRLPEITTPALILVGDHEDPDNLAHARTIVSSMPNASLIIMENAGHVLYLEHPAQFAAHVLEFVKERTR